VDAGIGGEAVASVVVDALLPQPKEN